MVVTIKYQKDMQEYCQEITVFIIHNILNHQFKKNIGQIMVVLSTYEVGSYILSLLPRHICICLAINTSRSINEIFFPYHNFEGVLQTRVVVGDSLTR